MNNVHWKLQQLTDLWWWWPVCVYVGRLHSLSPSFSIYLSFIPLNLSLVQLQPEINGNYFEAYFIFSWLLAFLLACLPSNHINIVFWIKRFLLESHRETAQLLVSIASIIIQLMDETIRFLNRCNETECERESERIANHMDYIAKIIYRDLFIYRDSSRHNNISSSNSFVKLWLLNFGFLRN